MAIKITTRVRYGTRAMVELAKNKDVDKVSITSIAERQKISRKYLERIFSDLRKNGLVEGCPGKHGGYRLGRPAGDITMLDVYESLEGSVEIVPCRPDRESCLYDRCPTRRFWDGVSAEITKKMKAYTLEMLVSEGSC